MIQRIGGNSRGIHTGGGGSGHGPSSSRRKSPANHNDNHRSPPRGASTNNNGMHTPARHVGNNYVVHHQDLSPESKARKQAMMMKRQEQQQQRQLPPPSTQQSSASSYHTARMTESSNTIVNVMYTSDGQSSKTLNTSNLTDNLNSSTSGGGAPVSPLVQGMNNLSVSSQQKQQHQSSPQNSQIKQPQPKSPPSPRPQLLRKVQNNDEEDWEKAWAEDSESDDDEEGGSVSEVGIKSPPSLEPSKAASSKGAAVGGATPTFPSGVVGGQATGRTAVVSTLPYRPDVDSGHSSASVQVIAPPTAAMHSAFTPTKPQPSQQSRSQQQQQQLQPQHRGIGKPPPSAMKTPIIQYPPIQPKSTFASPEFPSTPREIEEDARLLRQADDELQGGEERWDTFVREEELDERPCVDMFDPALRVLGRGSFGRVVLVQKQRGQGTGSLYAMKILRKSHLVRRRQIERTKTERKVLSVLDHPFIMKMYYAFQTTEKLFLVLDYCPGGELFFHLSRYRRFQEPVARFYAAELLLAIGHLHKNGIIYRDLKPENVLLDAYGHVKLGDFGLAKDGIRHPTQGAKSTCGTPEYMAPEVLNQGGHGFCVDYWGLGMLLYEMMTGLPPWYTTDRSKLFKRLRSAPLVFPNEVHFSPHCRACIAGLLDREPRLRLGVMGLRSAMRHEFFYRRINFEALRARQISAPIRPCEGWRQFNHQNSRNSSMAGGSDHLGSSEHHRQQSSVSHGHNGGWHSANPSLDSATMGGITAEALDVATANFDDSFKRMPIETEDYETQQQAAGHPPISENELNSLTFRGFTFDGDLPHESDDQTHYQHQQHPSAGRPPSSGHHGASRGAA